jgi:hypothetical protein
MESRLGRLIGVDGPLYALRRDCYFPLEHHIISDLVTPLLVLEKGNKVVMEPEAFVFEDPTHKPQQEFTTRRRITLRGLVGLTSYSKLLNPLTQPALTFQILLHKVLRWFVGLMLLLNILATCALCGHWFFKCVLVIYFSFFLAAVLGYIAQHLGMKPKVLTVPYYFILVNLAATLGIIDFIRKKQAITWKPIRE